MGMGGGQLQETCMRWVCLTDFASSALSQLCLREASDILHRTIQKSLRNIVSRKLLFKA